jgi:excisionase family DNA binding protein
MSDEIENPDDEVLDRNEACEFLDIGVEELAKELELGRVPAYMDGDTWRFDRGELDFYKRHRHRSFPEPGATVVLETKSQGADEWIARRSHQAASEEE